MPAGSLERALVPRKLPRSLTLGRLAFADGSRNGKLKCHERTKRRTCLKVRGILDLVDARGAIRDVKTAARKPSYVAPDYALQIATYAEIAPQVTGEAQLVTLVATKTPQLVTMAYRVSDADRAYARAIYPRVQDAMRAGVVTPNRGSNLCSRKHCSFWQACEAEYGGRVKGAAADAD